MAISKKQAKQIANLVNACTVWTLCVRADLDKGDRQAVRTSMARHDEAAKELNTILGQEAVCLYNQGV